MALNKTMKLVLAILISFIILIIGMNILDNYKGEETPSIGDIEYQRFGDLLSQEFKGNYWSTFNVFSYIAGGVPQPLINEVGNISAAIVIFALFIMFAFTFWDILSNFGLFSSMVAGVISVSLSIVLANLKVVMWLAVWCFGIVAGVGALSVAVGIIVPFVIFAVLNIFLAKALKEWGTKKDIEAKGRAVQRGAGAVSSAISSLKEAAKSFGAGEKK